MQTASGLLLLLSLLLGTVAMAQDRNSDEEVVRLLDDRERIAALDRDVSALEGLWWAEDLSTLLSGDKSEWNWTMMIRQPDAATPDLLAHLADEVATKKSIHSAKELRLISFEEGTAAQVLHVGPYATEASTIVRLHEFIREQGFTFDGHRHKHHEIYLGDPRRSAPEKLRTIIRQPYAAS